jgi:cytochrome P450
MVIGTINNFMNDPEAWENADLFDPDRFLIDGIFNSNIQSNFSPFGVGKRICLGEKLAQNNLFLILAGILRKTKGMKFSLPNGSGSGDLEPDELAIFMVPKKSKIFLERD